MIKVCTVILQSASLNIPLIDMQGNLNNDDTRECSGLDDKDSVDPINGKEIFNSNGLVSHLTETASPCIADKNGTFSERDGKLASGSFKISRSLVEANKTSVCCRVVLKINVFSSRHPFLASSL